MDNILLTPDFFESMGAYNRSLRYFIFLKNNGFSILFALSPDKEAIL